MKGAMEHAGSTCCSIDEHRWPLLVEVGLRLDNTVGFLNLNLKKIHT